MRIRAALIATNEAMNDVVQEIHSGTSHSAVWYGLRMAMTSRGLTPRNVTIGIGPSSSFAFTLPTDYVIKDGDLVKFDHSGVFEAYLSDTGRTGVVGQPSARQSTVYEAILAAQQAGCEAVRPGVLASEIYRVICDVARRHGLDGYSRPSLGHGIGLEVYDPPVIRANEDVRLQPGMVLNVEAPFYELGFGGVQVEDTLLVTDSGFEYLAQYPHELFVCH
jgi:Xaa-Pro aminopeptidase